MTMDEENVQIFFYGCKPGKEVQELIPQHLLKQFSDKQSWKQDFGSHRNHQCVYLHTVVHQLRDPRRSLHHLANLPV